MKQSIIRKIINGKATLLIILILIVLLITYIRMPNSFTKGNAQQILSNLCFYGMFGVGVAMLLMGGGFDFATSAHATISTLVFYKILQWIPGIPWGIAAIISIIAGALCGGVNAFLSQGIKLMPFIATIGMSSVWSGLAQWATRGQFKSINNPGFSAITAKCIGKTPIPWLFLFVIAVVVAYSVVLKWTRFGRSVLVCGGNPAAARLAGLNPDKIKSILYINNGILAAVGGLIWSSQQKMYNPTGLTSLMPEMTSLTAAMLGGVSFMGGSGTLGSAFMGIVLITTLSYALQTMQLPLWFTTLVNGLLLVIALTIDSFASKKIRKNMATAGIVMPGMR
ncbi:MAG: ABC transporter permease [Clostridiales bacterium]|nr:ABC transporter permease [Clostridiales bacterium]